MEAANKGSCTGGTPAATFGPSKRVVQGGIPYKTLSLPKAAAYDGWGRRISNAAWLKLTEEDAFLTYPTSDSSCGTISVADDSGQPFAVNAAYVVFSAGKDGHGGYTKTGQRISAGVTNAASLNNCNCDSAGAATTYDNSYTVQDLREVSATDRFDDLVRYKYRWQLASDEDLKSTPDGLCAYGFRAEGTLSGKWGAKYMSTGDINGDGLTDLGITYPYSGTSYIYVVFGRSSGFSNPVSLAALDGTDGFQASMNNYTHFTAGIMGDFNGDGYSDLVSMEQNPAAGKVNGRVLFGKASGWAATFTMASKSNGTEGYRIQSTNTGFGSPGGLAAGDINNDGYDDMMLRDKATQNIWIIYGHANPWAATLAPDTGLDGTNGFTITNAGCTGDGFYPQGSIGDINNDGYADMMWYCHNIAPPGSTGYKISTLTVLYGSANPTGGSPTIDLSTPLNGTNGFYIGYLTGAQGGGVWGSVIPADMNGDGIKDMVFGAGGGGYDGGAGSNPGAITIVFGKASAWNQYNDVDTLLASGQAVYINNNEGTGSTCVPNSMSTGDFNNDGISDLVVTQCPLNVTTSPNGVAYVIFGRSSGWANRKIRLTPFTGTGDGMRIDCSYSWEKVGGGNNTGCGALGWTSSDSQRTTDFNGDGLNDFFLGASGGNSSTGATNVGYAMFWYGTKSTKAWPATIGTSEVAP